MHGPVLVTGAAGFAGSHLVDLLAREGVPLYACHRPGGRPPGPASRPHGVAWRAVDMLDRTAVRALIADLRPAAILHCAGAAHVGVSFNRTTPTFEANVLGTQHVLDAVRRAGLDIPVLVPGSALVYRASAEPVGEDHPVGPSSPYALSKLAQELLARHAHQDDGLRVLLPRAFNHIGPRQDPSYSVSGFARQIALIEAGLREPALQVGNLDARRDFTDVRDTVRAYRLLLERGQAGRIYNVCSGRAYAVGGLLDALLTRARVKVTIRTDPARFRPHDIPIMVGDPRRIGREVGWQPEIPIERTLEDLLAYWRTLVLPSAVRTD